MISCILEKMSTITLNEREEIMRKCEAALDQVKWNNNISFTADTTIAQALLSARSNKDAGLKGALSLLPSTLDFHEWMDFIHLITVYYNFDKDVKKFTILRKGWYNFIAAYIFAFGTCIKNVLNCLFYYYRFFYGSQCQKLGP